MWAQELVVIGHNCKVKICGEFLNLFKKKVPLLHYVGRWASDINVKLH